MERMHYCWRQPTEQEYEALNKALQKEFGGKEPAPFKAEEYPCIVCTNYISDGPGYAGKLMVMLGGLPEMTYVWEWHKQAMYIHILENLEVLREEWVRVDIK